MSLGISTLQTTSVERCIQSFHNIEHWTPMEWGCALAGEVGELCNFLKKENRDKVYVRNDIADELADVLCYLVLLAERCGIDLESAVINKFNRVSEKKGSDVRLSQPVSEHLLSELSTKPPWACPFWGSEAHNYYLCSRCQAGAREHQAAVETNAT